jgi:hypothetical protein
MADPAPIWPRSRQNCCESHLHHLAQNGADDSGASAALDPIDSCGEPWRGSTPQPIRENAKGRQGHLELCGIPLGLAHTAGYAWAIQPISSLAGARYALLLVTFADPSVRLTSDGQCQANESGNIPGRAGSTSPRNR